MRRIKTPIDPARTAIADRRRKARRKEEKELRAAVPKGTDFRTLSYADLLDIANALNWSTGRVKATAERCAKLAKRKDKKND